MNDETDWKAEYDRLAEYLNQQIAEREFQARCKALEQAVAANAGMLAKMDSPAPDNVVRHAEAYYGFLVGAAPTAEVIPNA